jgi:hypothetical protein
VWRGRYIHRFRQQTHAGLRRRAAGVGEHLRVERRAGGQARGRRRVAGGVGRSGHDLDPGGVPLERHVGVESGLDQNSVLKKVSFWVGKITVPSRLGYVSVRCSISPTSFSKNILKNEKKS